MKILTEAQRSSYLDRGYCAGHDWISGEWLDRLNQVTNAFVEESIGDGKLICNTEV